MDYPLIVIDSKTKSNQEAERVSWKGLDLKKVGMIGEGLFNKSLTPYQETTFERFKKLMGEISSNFLKFSPVSEKQLVKSGPPSNMYSKSSFSQSKHLLYKVQKADARLVRSILEIAGFNYTDSHDWNVMWLGCNAKLYLYDGLNVNQRINHFPNSYEITRKDKMCSNLMAMQRKFGTLNFDFFPETFVIPNEFNQFALRYRNEKDVKWIVKPSNSSQGRGIFLLDNIHLLRSNESCVVSRFIHNPLLINDLKFDLRIYVLVTSFEPLKIYVYDEGLARFASEKYSNFSSNNKFSFLTNYSINKLNDNFVQNEDFDHDNVGHKWSLSALMKFLNESGIDTHLLTNKIYDLIIKTIITAENTVVQLVRQFNLSRNNCFDLFGFDILIDSNLKPWLLEVNLSPSLATDSPLDLYIKGNLVSELFNIIGVKAYDRRITITRHLTPKLKNSRPQTATKESEEEKYNEMIKETLEEFLRAKHFVRIYPCEGCQIYDKFFLVVRKINKVLANYLFSEKIIKEVTKEIISEVDILIEFLTRIVGMADNGSREVMWDNAIMEFVDHEIWKKTEIKTFSVSPSKRLLEILVELKKRYGKMNVDPEVIEQKSKILQQLTNSEIEERFKNSKSEISGLVACFLTSNGGILTSLENQVSQTPKRAYLDLKSAISKHKNQQ